MARCQEEEARQIALLEEAMRASPSLVSMVSDQLLRVPGDQSSGAGGGLAPDNVSMRSFRASSFDLHRTQSFLDSRGRVVSIL